MRRAFADTSIGQIHYREMGSGKPLLLLGSSGRSSRMFAPLIPLLARQRRVLAPDLPGFGASAAMPPGMTIEALADLTMEFLDAVQVGPAVAVYGFHTGNKIGTAMAVRHEARVEKLIIAGQTHSLVPDNETRNAGIKGLIASHVTLDQPEGRARIEQERLAARVSALFGLGDIGSPHPHLGGAIGDHILDDIEATATAELYRANLNFDLAGGFAAVRVPTLILEIETTAETAHHGLQGQAVRRLIPHARIETVEVPEDGVLTLENHADRLAPVILGFLGS